MEIVVYLKRDLVLMTDLMVDAELGAEGEWFVEALDREILEESLRQTREGAIKARRHCELTFEITLSDIYYETIEKMILEVIEEINEIEAGEDEGCIDAFKRNRELIQ